MTLMFAGTSDAREYAARLADKGEKLIICTATAYGASLIGAHENIKKVYGQPFHAQEIERLAESEGITKIIDATHPYAQEISANIVSVCTRRQITLERYERESYFKADSDVVFAKDYDAAAKSLANTQGKILLTIGSRRLTAFVKHVEISRMVIRVLPTSKVLTECESLGFIPAQIIAAQGPFSQDFNASIYDDYGIKHLVTKDSGSVGGVAEKVLPALERDIHVVVIKRPEE